MHLLFDFDGTLVDSFRCVIDKTILLADEFNFKKIKEHEIDDLRDLSSIELVKYLKIPLYRIPQLIIAMRKHLHDEIPKIPPVRDIPQVLEQLHHAKFSLSILTSNSADNVSLWLEKNKLRHVFSVIHVESDYFSKTNLLKKILKAEKIDKSQIIFVGDETRDIDAANENEVKSVAVTWGYNSEKVLSQCQPTFIVRKPEEILSIVNL